MQCHVCGTIFEYAFQLGALKENYQVGYVDICWACGDTANSFINYYGVKKPEDLARLHQFLISGVLPMRDFSTLMNAGYWL